MFNTDSKQQHPYTTTTPLHKHNTTKPLHSSDGDKMITRAIRVINPGEQIFVSYGLCSSRDHILYILLHVWLSWLRHQIHKQYDTGSSLVRTIKMGLKIILKSELI